MPKLKPVSLRELIRRLRALGFDGPYHGGKHPVMFRGDERYPIPNQHYGEIGVDLLARILREAEISRESWESVA